MIAAACIRTGLPPEAFGVPASEEFGAVLIALLNEQTNDDKHLGILSRQGH